MINNDVLLRIFVKDLIAPNNTSDNPTLFSVEGNALMANPNIGKVWPDVEAKGVGKLQNVLGQLGKRNKIEVVEMSEGYDMWDSDFIIFGAQGMKNREFYKIMKNVGYGAD